MAVLAAALLHSCLTFHTSMAFSSLCTTSQGSVFAYAFAVPNALDICQVHIELTCCNNTQCFKLLSCCMYTLTSLGTMHPKQTVHALAASQVCVFVITGY